MKRKLVDVLYLEIMLGDEPGKQRRVQALATQARALVEGRRECPECADRGPHDDNGATRLSELSWCCRACGTHFDAEEV